MSDSANITEEFSFSFSSISDKNSKEFSCTFSRYFSDLFSCLCYHFSCPGGFLNRLTKYFRLKLVLTDRNQPYNNVRLCTFNMNKVYILYFANKDAIPCYYKKS